MATKHKPTNQKVIHMGFKDQLKKLGDNWLLIVIAIIVLVVASGGGGTLNALSSASRNYYGAVDTAMAPNAQYAKMSVGAGIAPVPVNSENFAPDVTQRMIVKTGSLGVQVDRGTFTAAEQRMKGIVAGSAGLILDQNVYTSSPDNTDAHASRSGSYTIKVSSDKYDTTIAQLKSIGTVQTFNENANDVTGQYQDLNIELKAEEDRLVKYQALYSDDKTLLADRITLTDTIFNQERQIEYLKQAIANTNQRVDYSTISLQISEKQSDFVNVMLVKWSELVRTFVDSVNSVFTFAAMLLPWIIAALIIWLIVHFVRKLF